MAGLGDTVRSLGTNRLLALAGVLVGLVIFFTYLTGQFSRPAMSPLYSNLDLKDSGEIVAMLESQKIPYELRANGTQVLVPGDMVAKVRIEMAADGLPAGGSVGYEIFDKEQSFTTSNFVQNVNQIRALEGELARTISSIKGVDSARVHLVLPQRQLFTRDRSDATASIILKMRGSSRLDAKQVSAIQHLAAGAVPGLKINNVSIIDNQGELLARGGDDEGSGAVSGGNSNDMRASYENRLARSIESMLGRTLGPDKVQAQVSAQMNFDRIVQKTEAYDPEGAVPRSVQSISENNQTTEAAAGGAVSVQQNLPEGQNAQGSGAANNQNRSERVEETTNFEITRTETQKVQEVGEVERLSVSVLVDGVYSTDAEGKEIYQPRSKEELEQIETLVKTAIGFDAERGDQVSVLNMPFTVSKAEVGSEPTDDSIFGLNKDDLIRFTELGILGIISILTLLLVVRPLIMRLTDVSNNAPSGGGANLPALPGRLPPPPSLPPGMGEGSANLPATTGVQQPSEIEEMINLSNIEGQIKASSLRRVGQLVEQHPEETVAIVRNWLYSGGN